MSLGDDRWWGPVRPRGVSRPGLRTTITASFALGALLLSAAMALGTYLLARGYLVEQRERVAARQAFADASYVRDGLLTRGAEVSDVLGEVTLPADGAIVLRRGDEWFSTSLRLGQDQVPGVLRRTTASGGVALVWQREPTGPAVVVAVPLPAVDAQLFEVVGTAELDRTLGALRVVLMAVAALTAVAGAVLGWRAALRVVAPLDDVAGAAAQIAAGALDTRLPPTDDPDLATIVASFNSMADAVDERIERDARFAADVSHELRTPLTTLVTSVEVLRRRRDELSDRSRQALDLIQRDLERFQRVLEDLLELGRLEAGAAGFVLTPVEVSVLVQQALSAAGLPFELARLPQDGTCTTVTADKAALHRALVNLVENAQRHGGGLTGVTVEADGCHVCIHVDDTGPGVPVGERAHIFDRFVRGGSRGSLPGAGLGLSLVAETVHAHGGQVWCSAGVGGQGARLTVRLPALAASA